MADRYRTVLLFGAPGAGKGTQGKILGAIPGFHHFSTGDMFRNLDPRSELGKTFLGYSTALLLRNTPPEAEVISIDLGDDSSAYRSAASYTDAELRSDDKKNDDYLRFVQASEGQRYLRGLSSEQHARLKLLHGDSTRFDAGPLAGRVDFVFVDGGHDTATIRSDTQKSLQMTGNDGVIAWHDFDSRIHSDVTDFVHGFAADHLVFHVENTMLAFLFRGNTLQQLVPGGA